MVCAEELSGKQVLGGIAGGTRDLKKRTPGRSEACFQTLTQPVQRRELSPWAEGLSAGAGGLDRPYKEGIWVAQI